MIDAIFSFIAEKFPAIAVLLIGGVIGGYAVRFYSSVKTLSKKVDTLPCGEHTRNFDEHTKILDAHTRKHDEHTKILDAHTKILDAHTRKHDDHTRVLADHTNRLSEIKVVLSEMSAALINKKMIEPSFVLQRLSPYSLTAEGERYLNVSGGKACIDQNIDFFIAELEKLHLQTAYDVERGAFNVIYYDGSKQPFFKKIKDYVFVDKDGMPFITAVMIMSIYLRDIYLEKYPELLPEMEAATV